MSLQLACHTIDCLNSESYHFWHFLCPTSLFESNVTVRRPELTHMYLKKLGWNEVAVSRLLFCCCSRVRYLRNIFFEKLICQWCGIFTSVAQVHDDPPFFSIYVLASESPLSRGLSTSHTHLALSMSIIPSLRCLLPGTSTKEANSPAPIAPTFAREVRRVRDPPRLDTWGLSSVFELSWMWTNLNELYTISIHHNHFMPCCHSVDGILHISIIIHSFYCKPTTTSLALNDTGWFIEISNNRLIIKQTAESLEG